MTFDDNSDPDSGMPDFQRYYLLHSLVKEAQSNAEYIYLEMDELEDAVSFFIDEGIYENANELLQYALVVYPDAASLSLLKAELLIIQKKFDEARAIINEVEKKEPYLTNIYVLKAAIFEAENDEAKALIEYNKALENKVDEPEIIFEEMGYFFFYKADYKNALDCFDKYITIDNENLAVFEMITNIFIETQTIVDGLIYFEDYTSKFPECPFAWFSLARLFETDKQYAKAVKTYENGLRIDDTHTDAILSVLNCLRILKDYKRVIKICNYYKNFNYPIFLVEKAETYIEMDELELARTEYLAIFEKDPESTEAIVGISNILKLEGYFEKALNFINAALLKDDNNVVLLINKAFLLKDSGAFDSAIELFEKIVSMEFVGDVSKIYFHLAETYLFSEDLPSAINSLTEALENYENDTELRFLLAACYFLNGETDNAHTAFEDAMSGNCDNSKVFFEKVPEALNDNMILEIMRKNGLM